MLLLIDSPSSVAMVEITFLDTAMHHFVNTIILHSTVHCKNFFLPGRCQSIGRKHYFILLALNVLSWSQLRERAEVRNRSLIGKDSPLFVTLPDGVCVFNCKERTLNVAKIDFESSKVWSPGPQAWAERMAQTAQSLMFAVFRSAQDSALPW